jgi:hypothetical protein
MTPAILLLLGFASSPASAAELDPELLGRWPEFGNPPNAIAVDGAYAYCVFSAGDLIKPFVSGLGIFDVSRPEAPTLVGSYRSTAAQDVFVRGSHAYLADLLEGLVILDVRDPARPRRVAEEPLDVQQNGGGGRRVFVSGSLAYVADNFNGLVVVDVGDPASPRLVGEVVWPGLANGILVAGGHVYVVDAYDRGSLQVIDVSSPDRPQLVGRYEGRLSTDFSIAAGHAFVAGAGGLAILDLTDPRNPQRIGFHPSLVEGVVVSDVYAYASGFSAELQVVDVSRPDSPRRVGGYRQDMGVFTRLSVSGNHAYVANPLGAGLEVLDVSDPGDPWRAGANSTLDGYEIQQIFASEGAVFVAAGSKGLVIFDELRDEEMPPRFRRGDANGDGGTNLTDAVFTLDWLFRGGPTPGCVAAANVNGDRGVNVTDPIYLLGHLFQGGPPPPAPFPDCGPGAPEADGAVGCALLQRVCR